jgi:hypothetical protein
VDVDDAVSEVYAAAVVFRILKMEAGYSFEISAQGL